MKKHPLAVVVVFCALSLPSFALVPGRHQSADLSPLIKSMPDYCQVDQRYGRLPGGGAQYCAPTAISNILVWLDRHGFPDLVPGGDNSCRSQYRLIKTLGSEIYMKTDKNTGTSPLDTMAGLERYAKDRGYDIDIEWKGWRDGGKYAADKPIPTLAWIRDGAKGMSNMIISVGWYTYDARNKVYERLGGHYVTLVGVDAAGKGLPRIFIHNPSFGSGPAKNPKPEVCRLIPITDGSFGPWCEYDRHPAKSYYRIQGIRMRSDADYAILDGAIRFELFRKPDDNKPDTTVTSLTPARYTPKKDL